MLVGRVVPVAPFALVNMVAGAVQIRLRDFILGTIVGMTPGIFGIAMLEDQLEEPLGDPAIERASLLFGLAVFFSLVAVAVYRWYAHKRWRDSAQQKLHTAR